MEAATAHRTAAAESAAATRVTATAALRQTSPGQETS